MLWPWSSSRLQRSVAAVVAVSAFAVPLLSAPPAASEGGDAHSAMTSSYGSLSSALIGAYAAKSNLSVEDYLAGQQLLLAPATLDASAFSGWDTLAVSPELAAGDPSSAPTLSAESPSGYPTLDVDGEPVMPGVEAAAIDVASASSGGLLLLSADQLAGLTGTVAPVQASSAVELDALLAASGLTVSDKKYSKLSDLARQVTRAARTPDGAVTLAGAAWASQMRALRAPALARPGTPSAAMPGISADALPFGLLMNKALTQMIADNPDMVGAAQASGLGSAKLQTAWNTAMFKAYTASNADLTTMLPNRCVGVMMGVMATGDTKTPTNGCAKSCIVAGQYLHAQSGAAFDPQRNSMESNVANPLGNVFNYATFDGFSSWARQYVATQNPSLVGVSTQPTPSPQDCADGAAAAAATSRQRIPGILSRLSR